MNTRLSHNGTRIEHIQKRNPAEAGSLKGKSIIVDAQQEMGFRLVSRNDGSPIMSN